MSAEMEQALKTITDIRAHQLRKALQLLGRLLGNAGNRSCAFHNLLNFCGEN